MQIHSAVSSASIQQMQKQMFSKADADGNGGLSLEEFKAVGKNMPAGIQLPAGAPDPSKIFAKLDANENGELSQAELANAPHPNFDAGMSQNILQSLQDGETSLADALFKHRDADDGEKRGIHGVKSNQDVSSVIEQYLANYLSTQTSVTDRVTA